MDTEKSTSPAPEGQAEPRKPVSGPLPTNWRVVQPWDDMPDHLEVIGDQPGFEIIVCSITNPRLRGNPQHILAGALRFLEAIEKAQAVLGRHLTPEPVIPNMVTIRDLLEILDDKDLVAAVRAARGAA